MVSAAWGRAIQPAASRTCSSSARVREPSFDHLRHLVDAVGVPRTPAATRYSAFLSSWPGRGLEHHQRRALDQRLGAGQTTAPYRPVRRQASSHTSTSAVRPNRPHAAAEGRGECPDPRAQPRVHAAHHDHLRRLRAPRARRSASSVRAARPRAAAHHQHHRTAPGCTPARSRASACPMWLREARMDRDPGHLDALARDTVCPPARRRPSALATK